MPFAGFEQNRTAIGAKASHHIRARVPSQPAHLAAASRHYVHILVVAVVRGKCQPFALWRKQRIAFYAVQLRQPPRRAAIAACQPEIIVVMKG
jgi:hypothetical protein